MCDAFAIGSVGDEDVIRIVVVDCVFVVVVCFVVVDADDGVVIGDVDGVVVGVVVASVVIYSVFDMCDVRGVVVVIGDGVVGVLVLIVMMYV